MLSALSVCFVLEFRLFFPLRRTAGINGGDDKSTLLDGQAQKLGRLPAKLLQTEVCIAGLWVTVLYQFFASSTSSFSVLKPLSWKTSVT